MDEEKTTRKEERRKKDINDIKTVEGVMDKKTATILHKLRKQGVLKQIHGVVSAGKEASIYLASASSKIWSKMCRKNEEEEEETEIAVAIKVYKTSTMLFKDRERYIVGERRFKRYAKGNSRKLVKLWAEKEARNLNRLQKHGIHAPKPLFLRRNILIMSMIGDGSVLTDEDTKVDSSDGSDGSSSDDDSNDNHNDDNGSNNNDNIDDDSSSEESSSEKSSDEESIASTVSVHNDNSVQVSGMGGIAPNIKAARLEGNELACAYAQVVAAMQKMYKKCGLVHADLSEYNLLYWHKKVYVIDVGQSVERDHANADEFLRMDIANITAYFSKHGVETMSTDELYTMITAEEEAEDESTSTTTKHKQDAAEGMTKKQRKETKRAVKEQNRERRSRKLPKKEKKKLARKIQIMKRR